MEGQSSNPTKDRLASPVVCRWRCAGPECRQAAIRLGILTPLLSAVAFLAAWQSPVLGTSVALQISAGLLAVALSMLVASACTRRLVAVRRCFSAIFDPGAVSFMLLIGAGMASPLVLAYPVIIVDHARRFGNRGLYATAVCSTLGFGLVLLGSDYWQANASLGFALLAGLTGFPVLVARHVAGGVRGALPRPASPATGARPDSETHAEFPGSKSDASLEPSVHQPDLGGRKVLLLSNDRSDWHGIRRHLDSWGAETCVCENVARAFAALIDASNHRLPFHVVIADHGQFDLDSRQFALCVRSDPSLQQLCLVHIGPPALQSLSDQLHSAGYSRLLRKPVDKTLLFSAVHAVDPERFDDEPRVARLLDHYASRTSCQPLSILLAEPHANDRQRIRMILQRAGHQVFVVEDGDRVLEALDSHRFDVAIVAIELQKIGGLEVFKLYRFAHLDKNWVPFVMLCDASAVADAQACVDAGVDTTVKKPFDSRALLETVANAVHASLEANLGMERNKVTTIHGSSRAVVIDGLTLDGQRLDELVQLGKGRKFVAELLENFDRDCEQFSEWMGDAAQSGDLKRFRDLGHAIKDSAGSLGMLNLYHLGMRAAKLPLDQFPDQAMELLRDLKQCCRGSYKALQQYLAEHHTSMES